MEVRDHFLTIGENKEVRELLFRLTALGLDTTELLDEATSLLDARSLFNGIIQKYPRLHSHLHAGASIIENPALEMAICKIEDGKEAFLSRTE